MANNNFDIKVFTDELNKAFTILKKEQVLEKYMKNILLNYNSIIYINNITTEPNKYDAIYKYMYGEDNTLCNIVVFETDGFVDSETNIIPSGIHIAYPYLDYYVCIDYKYKLNPNNSAELLSPTQEFKTINNESILGEGNISVQENLVSGSNIKTINGQTILGSGNIEISGGGNTDVIGFIECTPNSILTDDKLQKLLSKKYGLYITGEMFFPTSEVKRFYTVPHINYLGTYIQLGYKDVYINQDNSLSSISTNLIDIDIKKTYPYSRNDVYLDREYITAKNTNLTNIGIAIGFNSYCHGKIKETINDKRFNHLYQVNDSYRFNFEPINNGKPAVDLVDILKFIFSYYVGPGRSAPTVELNPSSPVSPKIWNNGQRFSGGIYYKLKCLCKLNYSNIPNTSITTLKDLYNGIVEKKFSRRVVNKFSNISDSLQKDDVCKLIRLSIILNLNYNTPVTTSGDNYYNRGWTGTMIDYYYEILLVPDVANKDIYVYYRINRFK